MDKNFTTRNFVKGDFNDVMKLWIELKLGRPERGDTEETVLATIKNGGKMILLCDNDKIIGTSWLSTDGRRIFLHHFGINENYQGKGLAHFLLDESIKFAKEKKLQIKLEVRMTNIKALNLYINSGFKRIGDHDVYILRDPINTDLHNKRTT